jgi:hypothetical protein
MSEGHLDLLGLDAVRAGDATPAEQEHVAGCAECRAAVQHFRELTLGMSPGRIDVPPERSRAILRLARPRPRWRPVAAAAALLIGLGGLWIGLHREPAIPPVAFRKERPDIVDAYLLAARLTSGQPVDSSWDVNGDGRIDDRDVAELVRRSVSIR